jgi:hypothetical protein
MGRSGREYVRARYTPPVVVDRLMGFLSSLRGRR